MGIKNLSTIIEKYAKTSRNRIHLSQLKGYKVAVDANLYIFKHLYGKSNCIDGIFFMINKFLKFNITPIFIFDGSIPNEKTHTINQRKLNKDKIKHRILELRAYKEVIIKNSIKDDEINEDKIEKINDEINSLENRLVYVNNDIFDKIKELLRLMNIKYNDNTNCESEQYCSKLCKIGIVDAVVSDDTDTLACGSKYVIRNFTNKDDYVDIYRLDKILGLLELDMDQFIDMCILLGTDYNQRPRNLCIDEIYKLIKEFGKIEEIKSESLTKWKNQINIDKIRSILRLEYVDIDTDNSINKSSIEMVDELRIFMRDNSTLDEETYNHRIQLIQESKPSNYIVTSRYPSFSHSII